MGARVAGVLLLFAAAVIAEEHSALRALMAKQLGKDGPERVEIILPEAAPRAPADTSLFIESASGGCFGHQTRLIRFERRRDGQVRVRQIRDRVNAFSTTLSEFAVETAEAVLDGNAYDALVRDLLLIRAAKFLWRGDPPKYLRRHHSTLMYYTRTRVFLGGVLFSAELRARTAKEWDAARVWMYVDRVKQALERCEFRSTPLERRESAILLQELIAERAEKRRWGSAVTVRIRILGAVGYKPAVEELRKIPERSRTGYRAAQKSLRQIEILHAADPKTALLAQLEEPSHPAFPWARSLLRMMYRDDYKGFYVARVRDGDRRALAIVRDLAEDPTELEARGLTMSDAGKRASAEAAEWELTRSDRSLAALLKIVRDKGLADRPRTETIRLLQRIAPKETGFRDALLMLVVDHTDAQAVRDEAARTLRHHKSERTIALLASVQEQHPSDAIAETLRALTSR